MKAETSWAHDSDSDDGDTTGCLYYNDTFGNPARGKGGFVTPCARVRHMTNVQE